MTIEQIFADVFAIPADSVHDGLELRKIASWDSLSHMLLIIRIEELFATEFTGDEILDVASVGDVKKLLDRKRDR